MAELPDHISICSRNLGYHAYGAGPCFDTVEAAVAYRDEEFEKVKRANDAKADTWCRYDFEERRTLTWADQWAVQGWPYDAVPDRFKEKVHA